MLRLSLVLALTAALALAGGIGLGLRLTHERAADVLPAVVGAKETAELLAGIPQRGLELGEPDAPVTLVEYVDLQCPYCAYWARTTFPAIVREYVQPGKVKLVLRGLAFIGPDSREALKAALAAGAQNRLWHVVELLYLHQGPENSGWVDEALLRSLGGAVPGLDVDRMLGDARSQEVADAMLDAARHADAARVRGTPSFELGRTGGRLEPTAFASLNPDALRPALDALLNG